MHYSSSTALFYASDDDDDDDDDDKAAAAGQFTASSQTSSASITSCSLGTAVVTEARRSAATQLNDRPPCSPSVVDSQPPVNVAATSAPTRDSASVLTRQQVYVL